MNIKFQLVYVVVVWALLLSVGSAHAANDKAQHFAVSAALGAAASVATEDRSEHPVLCAVALAMVPGVLKEAYDAAHPKQHRAEVADLAADFAGALSGALLGHGVQVHLNRREVSINVTKEF